MRRGEIEDKGKTRARRGDVSLVLGQDEGKTRGRFTCLALRNAKGTVSVAFSSKVEVW